MRAKILLVSFAVLALPAPAMAAMTLTFDWGPTQSCFDPKSPPMHLSGVPTGTAKLDIRMVDLDAPGYPHGGATIDYTGQTELAYGAFHYKGPCPPTTHTYEFTAKALDASGRTIESATSRRTFPN